MILDKLFNLFVLQFLHCSKGMIILQRVFDRIKWITICGTFRPVSSTFLLGFISDCCSVVSNSLQPHELPHGRLPCFSLSLLESAQTQVCWVGDAIQPSHLLLHPSPSAFKLFQHQGLFQWVSSSHQVAKVLELQLQHQSFQRIFRIYFPLGLIGWISSLFKGLSRVFSSTTVWKHQFFHAQPSLWSNSHIHIWLLVKL